MISSITSRPWPPYPSIRSTCKRIWIEGEHRFYVSRLVRCEEWIGPYYGTRQDIAVIHQIELIEANNRLHKSQGTVFDPNEWLRWWVFGSEA
jgi:hypothetical protein